MKLTFFGTGTSHGIPVVGCSCPTCTSSDPKDRRTRASILVTADGSDFPGVEGRRNILVDTATEFRLQAVAAGLVSLDAVLYTHAHADHLHGLDDVRPLCEREPIPLYGLPDTLEELEERFRYIFRPRQIGGGVPRVRLVPVKHEEFRAAGVPVTPIPVKHGELDILGYRIGGFAYLTDTSLIPETSYPLLEGLDVLVIGALRHRPHPTHFSVAEALAEITKIRPRRAFLTHICHELGHEGIKKELPPGVAPSYDGLSLTAEGRVRP